MKYPILLVAVGLAVDDETSAVYMLGNRNKAAGGGDCVLVEVHDEDDDASASRV